MGIANSLSSKSSVEMLICGRYRSLESAGHVMKGQRARNMSTNRAASRVGPNRLEQAVGKW